MRDRGVSLQECVVALLTMLMASGSAAGQTTWHVDDDAAVGGDGASWATAFRYLQDGLSAAGAGDAIWVAQGTYRPDEDDANTNGTGDRFATFQLVSGVALYGGFDGTESLLEERAGLFDQTILSGDLLGDDGPDFANNGENSLHVVYSSGVDATARLDGFTVKAGHADGLGPDAWGAGMINLGANPTVNHCAFRSNMAQFGGGVFNDGSSPTVTECAFTGNSVEGGGGMYNYNSSSPSLTECTFADNTASVQGGGMANEFFSDPTVTAGTFSGNSADFGSGMSNYNFCSPTISESTFTANTAVDAGGGLYNSFDSSPTVTSSGFVENHADRGGGMFNYANSSPVISSCTLTDNLAISAVGGGIANHTDCHPTVTGSTFTGNTASGGGAMNNYLRSSPSITGCTFTNNTAVNVGGGIRNYVNSNPEIADCVFVGNRSLTGLGGGAICSEESDGTLVIRDCVFRKNAASESTGFTGWGGTVELLGQQATIEKSLFVGNSAEQGGGAVSNGDYSGLTLIECTFVDNVAHWGGALFNARSPARLLNCKFVGNLAELRSGILGLPGGSGAIGNAWQESSLEVINCLLAGNTAIYGAGINVTAASSAVISDSTVVFNKATSTGGGIFNGMIAPVVCEVVNSIVWGNETSQIETLPDSSTAVSYCCVEGGHVGPFVFPDPPEFVPAESGFWTVLASYDGATGQTTFRNAAASWVENELAGKLLRPAYNRYRHSLIVANTATTVTVWGDFTGEQTPGVPYEIHTYRLASSSPAINAADKWALPPDEFDLDDDGDYLELLPVDLDGQPRNVAHHVDIGAYEHFAMGDCVSASFCPEADVDCSGRVNGLDVAIMTSSANWGYPAGAAVEPFADANRDGMVNGLDVATATSSACYGR